MRKLLIGIIILLLLVPSVVSISVNKTSQSKNGKTLYVGGSEPGNYTKIQDAIDNANDGDTVFVYNGIYYENIVINVSIDLIGEDRTSTIIDGNKNEDVIYISKSANGGNITGFTIQNSGTRYWLDAGIEVCCYFDCISDNIIINNCYGIYILPYYDYNYCKEISHNNIFNNTLGIEISKNEGYVSPTYVNENYIENNIVGISISYEGYGEEYDGIRNYLYQNVITNNECGIAISNEINQNIFKNNITENKCGISLASIMWLCSNINIYQNNIIRNEYGIELYALYGDTCYNNIYLNNFKYNKNGIYISTYDISTCPFNNNISQNNFQNNIISAKIKPSYLRHNILGGNNWIGNYWDRPRILPKIIPGFFIFFPLFNIDWHPASEPYDILGSSNFVGCDIK
jgi:hypothetical protein